MQSAERRTRSAERKDARKTRYRSFGILQSRGAAFTLVEMLVVIGLVGMLAGMLTVALLYARQASIRVQCQENERQIGLALNQLALGHNGFYPTLFDAYPNPPNDTLIAWWERVFQQWEGDLSRLDTDPNTPGVQFPAQLPAQMKSLHCRMGGALQRAGDNNSYDNSISYGINFDVKDSGRAPTTPPLPPGTPRAYCASSTSSPYSPYFPGSLNASDKQPDSYNIAEIRNPGEFILLSEANTQDPNPANWTGGRISMAAISRDSGDTPLYNAPIVGRHGGRANVLFADMHVDLLEVFPAGPTARNVNLNTPLWTLPGN